MKRLAFVALVAVALAFGAARGVEQTVFTGSLERGNPLRTHNPEDGSLMFPNHSETEAACDPDSSENGVDAMWFALEPEMEKLDAVLTLPDPNTDGDVYFFTEDCTEIPYTAMAQEFIKGPRAPFDDNTEKGKVPEDSAFVLVNGFFGLNIQFTLTVG